MEPQKSHFNEIQFCRVSRLRLQRTRQGQNPNVFFTFTYATNSLSSHLTHSHTHPFSSQRYMPKDVSHTLCYKKQPFSYFHTLASLSHPHTHTPTHSNNLSTRVCLSLSRDNTHVVVVVVGVTVSLIKVWHFSSDKSLGLLNVISISHK